jgi:uncharacterized protein DUF1559
MSRKRWFIIVVAILCLTGCLVFLPCLQMVRDGEDWQWSAARLKQIGLALHHYYDVYGRLPPTVKRGNDGQPLHSWRVLLLPFLEQENLFKQFNLDEPWDSPHNKPLLEKIPRCYTPGMGRNDIAGMTHYQTFVGPGTAFERNDLSDSFLVVEAAHAVPWTEPADLVYAPDKPLPEFGGLFQQPIHLWRYEIGRRDGFNACFADGNVRFIQSSTDERTLRRLIEGNSREKPE